MSKKILMSEARIDYEMHLTARGLSPRTVRNAGQVINRWVDLVGDTRVDLIRPQHVDRFFGLGNWAPKTQNLYLSVLRGSFFGWCRRQGYLARDYDPTEGWRPIRGEKNEQFWLPVDEFAALLDAADNPRDRAVIAIGLYTFMRGSEIQTLRIQDIDLERYTITMYRWKTKQADTLPIPTELAIELERWLAEYKRLMVFQLLPEWYLVPARGPMPMAYDHEKGMLQHTGVEAELRPTSPTGKPYDCVKRALKKLGYETKGTGAHTLRRSGAYALYNRLRKDGYDGALKRVSSMLGHADSKTTEIYLSVSLERQQRNELLAGVPMFPDAVSGTVVPLKGVSGGNRG